MSLKSHAETELKLAGFYDEEADYGGLIPQAVMEIIDVFSKQGHSGYSAGMVTDIVSKLMMYENLSPLTYAPEEWNEINEAMMGRPGCYQNRRQSNIFSEDGGLTWYDVNDEDRTIHKGYMPDLNVIKVGQV